MEVDTSFLSNKDMEICSEKKNEEQERHLLRFDNHLSKDETNTQVEESVNKDDSITIPAVENSQGVFPLKVPGSFWEKYWTGNRSLRKGWSDELCTYFKEKNSSCVLSFKSHTCKNEGGRAKNFFFCYAKCKHSQCTSFFFRLNDPVIPPYSDLYLRVTQTGPINHTGEVHRRFIKGEQRKVLAKELETSSPAKMLLLKLESANKMSLNMGNVNDAPSSSVLQKISNDNKWKEDLDTDEITFMIKLIQKYYETWVGKYFNGFIQNFSINPFTISVCYSFTWSQKYKSSSSSTIYFDETQYSDNFQLLKPNNVSFEKNGL